MASVHGDGPGVAPNDEPARRRGLAVALVLAVVAAACTQSSSSDGVPLPTPSAPSTASGPMATSRAPTDGPDAEAAAVAATLCGWLVAADTRLGDVANDAVAGISAAPPASRHRAIMDGYDEAIRLAADLPAELDELELPDVPERDRLVAAVRAGAREAAAELRDERALFDAREPEVVDEDVFGIVGQFFNGFEKAMSVLEPDLSTDARPELQAAFLEEQSCRFVIQPFALDQ